MNTRFMYNHRVRQGLTIVLLTAALAAIFPSHQPLLDWWAAQAQWVALGYVLLAMALLVFNRTRLMFVCLGCGAAICLFYNEMNTAARLPDTPAQTAPAPDTNASPVHEFPTPRQ